MNFLRINYLKILNESILIGKTFIHETSKEKAKKIYNQSVKNKPEDIE